MGLKLARAIIQAYLTRDNCWENRQPTASSGNCDLEKLLLEAAFKMISVDAVEEVDESGGGEVGFARSFDPILYRWEQL